MTQTLNMPASALSQPPARETPARALRGASAVMWVVLLVAVFLATAGFRFLGLRDGFPNDHFVYITPGWQMQFGEWPTRDFADPGLPLMFVVSAAGQALFGASQLGEGVFVAVAFGLAAVLTMLAVRDLTGSSLLALLAAVLEVAIFPRTYGYPKMLAYAIAFWAFGRYGRRPTRGWLCAVAASVAVAFLFRHDHGLFLYVGAMLLVVLTRRGDGARTAAREAGTFTALLAAMLLPYALFVQAHTGIGLYLQIGLDYSQREADRQGHVWPSLFGGAPYEAGLVYGFHLLPLLAAAVLAVDRLRRSTHWLTQVAPIAVVAVLVNWSFIRDPLTVRLPDVMVPAVMLIAWLVMRALTSGRWRWVLVPVSAAVLVAVGLSVVTVGNTLEEIDRAGLLGGWRRIPERFDERVDQLQTRFFDSHMPRTVRVLVPFFDYLDRCTTAEHRLLSVGFPPDISFFARRRFAGGQSYFANFGSVPAQQSRIVARLRGQQVPFVFVPSDLAGEFDERFPVVAAYVRDRYSMMTEVTVSDDVRLAILVDRQMVPASVDLATGFPCFRDTTTVAAAGVRDPH